jgi:hypothetical protein
MGGAVAIAQLLAEFDTVAAMGLYGEGSQARATVGTLRIPLPLTNPRRASRYGAQYVQAFSAQFLLCREMRRRNWVVPL